MRRRATLAYPVSGITWTRFLAGDSLYLLGCILVVDDNIMVRESYTELLRHRGYAVLQAGDGEQALDAVAEQRH